MLFFSKYKQKIDNLIPAVESGIQMETMVSRLRELEREKQRIVSELERIRHPKLLDDSGIREISSQVSKTLLEFENSFDTLPVLRKKHLIRRFVHRIIVDRNEEKVWGYIRRIPKLEHPVVDDLYASASFNALCAHNGVRVLLQLWSQSIYNNRWFSAGLKDEICESAP